MNESPSAGFEDALAALPIGTFKGSVKDRRYVISKTMFNAGKSMKLVAEELTGQDYISFNFYRLGTGSRLFPCEMPARTVIDFVLCLIPDPLQDDA